MTKPKARVGDVGKGRGEDRERGGRLVGLSAGLWGQSFPSWELRLCSRPLVSPRRNLGLHTAAVFDT